MRSVWFPIFLSVSAPALAQEPSEEEQEEAVPPEIFPSQEGSSGVYHVRSAFTFPHPGAAFQGNDHFWGDTAYYQPDNLASRGVETRDCLTVNILDGIDFNAASIFRSYKVASDDQANEPIGVLGTPVPSILEALKVSYIAPDRSFAVGIEPFFEMKALPYDFAYDFAHSPYGARLLGTRDFRYDKGWPFRVHANLGYRRDRSAGVLTRTFSEDHGFSLPAFIPPDPPLSTEELYALGVPRSPLEAALGLFRDDQILVGFAAEYLTPWVTPFVEFSGEFVLGVAPRSSPQRLTTGFRFTPRPNYGDFSVDFALDFGLSKKGQLPSALDPSVLRPVNVEQPLIFTVGVGWVFGHRETVVVPVQTQMKPVSPTSQPTSEPANLPALPVPVIKREGREVRVAELRVWIPEQSELHCNNISAQLCSVKLAGSNASFVLSAKRQDAQSPFTEVGPTGSPLVESDAKQVFIEKQKAQRWDGQTSGGRYIVLRLSVGEYRYELSVEGATEEELKRYEEILKTASLR